jgi:hypothetical protein
MSFEHSWMNARGRLWKEVASNSSFGVFIGAESASIVKRLLSNDGAKLVCIAQKRSGM